jgi:NAD(P)-dependent dehydrogenase (short-subunit alcohol dehydrogenase family)
MKDLNERVAVITGGGSGIGRGTARALAEAGMKVVVSDIDGARAEMVAAEIRDRGAQGLAVTTDVSDLASVEALADRAYDQFGAVHVLHNNAGLTLFRKAESLSRSDWDRVLGVDLLGVVNGIAAFLPRMRAQDGEAHIVNTASMAGLIPGPGQAPYTASKFAVVGITEVLRLELEPVGIGASVLCPGAVETGIFQTVDKAALSQIDLSAFPHGEVLQPDAVGQMVRAGIENNELYIITHPELMGAVQQRADRIAAAFTRAATRGLDTATS